MKVWLGLVFIALVFFEVLFFEDIFLRMLYLWNEKSIAVSLYYIMVTSVGFFSMALFFFIREKIYFTLFFIFLLLTYAIDLVYKNINNVGFSLSDLTITLAEVDAFAVDALLTYTEAIKVSLFVLILLTIFIFSFRHFVHKHALYVSFKWVFIIFVFSLLLSFSIVYKTTGTTQTRPTSIKTVNTFIYYLVNKLYYGKREVLKEKPSELSKYKNIILIVDESVGGKYLSINGYDKETTPYLKSIKKRYINLGLASSGGNCSRKSNLILMSGIQLDSFPDKKNNSLKKPTIFQYAKNAGYKTYYISNQKKSGILQNYITKYDLEYIDLFFQPKNGYKHKSIPEEDIILKTKEALKNSDKNFIFMVKHGSHFQWEKSYPQSAKYFLPTLNACDPLSLDKKEEAVNSYLNAIKYNVDLFFEKFLEEIDFFNRKDTLIIYTSDHGQSILENGRISTHCDSKNPPLSQGIVPLLLFTNKEDTLLNKFEFKKDIYSHYQIFPTIQKLMGYENVSGETLFDISEKSYKQIFVSGDIFGRGRMQRSDINGK